MIRSRSRRRADAPRLPALATPSNAARMRALLVGIVSFLSVLAASDSATATVSINPTTLGVTNTATWSLIDSTGTSTQLTCFWSTISDVISSDGSGNVFLGGAQFSRCTLGIAATQTSAWTSRTVLLLSGLGSIVGAQMTFAIPIHGFRLRAALGCDVYIGGTQSFLTSTFLTTPPQLASVNRASSWEFGTTLGLSITFVTANSLCPQIALGDRVRFSSDYTFAPAISGTLI